MSDSLWTDVLSAWSSLASALIGLAALAAVVVVGVQIRLQRTQLHRELENMYVAHYWAIMDQLAESELSPRREGLKRRALAIRSYLRLSGDECDLRAANRVTDDTWPEWLAGMRTQLAEPGFREALDSAPQDQFRNLRKLVTSDLTFEPSQSSVRERRRVGL
ncbi:hypothetical protein [Microbacterium sp. C7(2022)]|uniref:hypothetical protein n=1 Tax=Microbacterium sp. C7(2022) TaxID=2992759 RepID=UPI00237BC07D|nr:hypothetical protein [Microbacterium sp. C7(2022)]MDE0547432.1 hypothetical protein [Microbacterium sp. C7(2022)]